MERPAGHSMLEAAARFLAAFALGGAVLALASCGGKPPEVSAVEWRLESRPGLGSSRYESLSAFGSIKDDDGIDNIEEVWIVNDDSALAWRLTSADWTKATEGSSDWIGGSSLAMPDLGPFPRGRYRLAALDAAGQIAELGFEVAGDFPAKRAPSLSYSAESGNLAVSSDWTETLVLAFDSAGALLRSVPAPPEAAPLSECLGQDMADRTALIAAYGYEPGSRMGAFSARIKTR